MNNDLISREALKRAIENRTDHIPSNDYDEGWNAAINTAIDEIDNAPTVEERADILYLCDTRITDCKKTSCQTDCFLTHDIKHAKNFKHIKGANCFVENNDENRPHGKWEEPFERNDKTYHKCSHCHISSELILFDNFCPNCGAQMDKGGDV